MCVVVLITFLLYVCVVVVSGVGGPPGVRVWGEVGERGWVSWAALDSSLKGFWGFWVIMKFLKPINARKRRFQGFWPPLFYGRSFLGSCILHSKVSGFFLDEASGANNAERRRPKKVN